MLNSAGTLVWPQATPSALADVSGFGLLLRRNQSDAPWRCLNAGGARYGATVETRKGMHAATDTTRYAVMIHPLPVGVAGAIDYDNDTMAKPFKWTMKGKPLVA